MALGRRGRDMMYLWGTAERNIFRSVHNVNLETVIGYRKGDIKYNFLDDYDDR